MGWKQEMLQKGFWRRLNNSIAGVMVCACIAANFCTSQPAFVIGWALHRYIFWAAPRGGTGQLTARGNIQGTFLSGNHADVASEMLQRLKPIYLEGTLLGR